MGQKVCVSLFRIERAGKARSKGTSHVHMGVSFQELRVVPSSFTCVDFVTEEFCVDGGRRIVLKPEGAVLTDI